MTCRSSRTTAWKPLLTTTTHDREVSVMLRYACPDCSTTNRLHKMDCDFEHTDIYDIEKAYIDILSYVLDQNSRGNPVRKRDVIRGTDEKWGELRHRVYGTLLFKCYLREDDDGRVELVAPDERQELRVPTNGAIQTVWETGTVPGCHDNGVFALVAWHAGNGFTWAETQDRLLEWFDRTGTWERGGFAEPSPEVVIEEKHHVYEKEYGWSQKAQAARNVIRNSSLPR